MSAREDRRAELIAAAAADELTESERAELRALADADPSVDDDIEDFRRVTSLLRHDSPRLPWVESAPSEELRGRVADTVGRKSAPDRQSILGQERTPGRTRPAMLAAAALVGVAVGSGVVLGVVTMTDRPVTGPPGTLGAFEQIDFTGTPSGVDIEGGLVPHTWGTETVLEVDGVPEPGSYEVYVVEESGTALASGSFLGSSVTIDCRMNAAVMRSEVSGIEIRKSDGSVLARAEVPDTR